MCSGANRAIDLVRTAIPSAGGTEDVVGRERSRHPLHQSGAFAGLDRR